MRGEQNIHACYSCSKEQYDKLIKPPDSINFYPTHKSKLVFIYDEVCIICVYFAHLL